MPTLLLKDIPSEVNLKLKDLETDFQEGDLTKKGFCKKKWQLLEPHLSADIVEKVHLVQKEFATTDLSENDYCDQVLNILKLGDDDMIIKSFASNGVGKQNGCKKQNYEFVDCSTADIKLCVIDHEEEIITDGNNDENVNNKKGSQDLNGDSVNEKLDSEPFNTEVVEELSEKLDKDGHKPKVNDDKQQSNDSATNSNYSKVLTSTNGHCGMSLRREDSEVVENNKLQKETQSEIGLNSGKEKVRNDPCEPSASACDSPSTSLSKNSVGNNRNKDEKSSIERKQNINEELNTYEESHVSGTSSTDMTEINKLENQSSVSKIKLVNVEKLRKNNFFNETSSLTISPCSPVMSSKRNGIGSKRVSVTKKQKTDDDNDKSIEGTPSDSFSTQKSATSSSRSAKQKPGVLRGKQVSLTSLFEKAAKRKEREEEEKQCKSFPSENSTDTMSNVTKKIKIEQEEEEKESGGGISGNCEDDEKTVKMEENDIQDKRMSVSTKKPKVVPQKCPTCLQLLDDPDLRLYQGHPNGAVEEFVALTDSRLSLFTGNEEHLEEGDERPQNKLTCFSIYDKAGHLCPFDTGLIERNVLLYFSGYIKAIYEESPDIEGGVPTKDMGPINEWWVSGFDGGELALVGFSTAYGEYYLMEPCDDYAPYMEAVKEKIFLSKLVIEFLVHEINPTYEDLLNKLHTTVPPKGITRLTEDSLLRHAQFVCDQILSFDSSALADEDLLITSPCMRALVKLSGVTLGKRIAMRRAERKDFKVSKPTWTKATTTELVQQNFESYFAGQLDAETEAKGPRRRRCGVCEACQHPDCGTCVACMDMVKYGGSGRGKQACVKRRCPNMAIEEAEDDDMEDEIDSSPDEDIEDKRVMLIHKKVRVHKEKVTWVGSPIKEEKHTYYETVKVGDNEYIVGDFVMVEPIEPGVPFVVCCIVCMWEDKKENKYFHAQFFCRATDTLLGDTADPHELFLIDACEDYLLGTIAYKANVVQRKAPENWGMLGGQKPSEEDQLPDNGKSFFYQKWYDPRVARFEDPKIITCDNKEKEHMFCSTCKKLVLLRESRMPIFGEKVEESDSKIKYSSVKYSGYDYSTGTSIFLKRDAFTFKTYSTPAPVTPYAAFKNHREKEKKVDEDLYPEFYRKSDGAIKGSNEETPKPFCIGHIEEIFIASDVDFPLPQDVRLRVKKFYRPENTHRGSPVSYQADLNLLYWTEEETVIKLSDVVRPCFVGYGENIEEPMTEWIKKGPHRFYFNQAYNSSTQTFEEPPIKATRLGGQRKGKGKGKGKGKVKTTEEEDKKNTVLPEDWPQLPNKLKCLDVFAGCGGLSEGLHEAGVAETCWAIEKEEAAANAFKLNNPKCTVFTDDCNALLKLVLNGDKTNDKGQVLPNKGEVELLCGGPPCQGFSGMNRFNSREYSKFKNSLIVSYLSYCDYFRPKYFILENVRNFVSFKNSIILKLTLRCLLRMSYQCTFGILQAGNYGVPQTRRRLIILAAAPGYELPKYPEPTHVFNLRASQLNCVVDGRKYVSNCQWLDSAPYRTITVHDAMSDLPDIRNGHRKDEMSYGGEPMSFFQRLMRGNQYQPVLRDHICKEMAPIVEARIANIPTVAGSDWRDLPNIVIRLSDGNFTKKLLYTHHHKKNGKSSSGALRGVCVCATGSGKPCDPMDRQYNTLIPWCLPHTANRHNHWAGLYGRLEWDGFFSTTVTNPEPMGKQGRVLHPEQSRVVSVRECARSQGFPDTYRFFGNILEKHRQVGNAVPPPMGAAIGYEIRLSYCKSY